MLSQLKTTTFICLILVPLTLTACRSTQSQRTPTPDDVPQSATTDTQPAFDAYVEPETTLPFPDCSEPGCDPVKDAFVLLNAEKFDLAAAKFLEAASTPSDLTDFLYVQAAISALQGSQNLETLKQIHASNALQKGYPGSPYLSAKIDALLNKSNAESPLPKPKTAGNALKSAQAEEVCNWLIPLLSAESTRGPEKISKDLPKLADHVFAYCTHDIHAKTVQTLAKKPSNQAHLHRAHGYFSLVRFRDANAQIEAITPSKLSKAEQCELNFLTARTVVRLRRIDDSNKSYQKVIDNCTEAEHTGSRVRSMYALGRYFHDKNRLDESQQMFQAILEEYPTLSHADDALFYLARVERKRGNDRKQHDLLTRALQEYPDGDMTHEMVWEVHESLIRTGKYKAFIDAISRLDLPDFDNQYFSQGRLEYFLAFAHFKLNNLPQAFSFWQKAWDKYPFSFYGYISNLRLRDNDNPVSPLLHAANTDEDINQRAQHITWFDGEQWKITGTQKLVSLRQFDAACDFETIRLRNIESTDMNKWRLAHICHQAKRFPLSHNIVRRQIPGRPWATPIDGVLVRWELAWPNPFQAKIADAHIAEAAQWNGTTVHPAFSTSIMREESSFIEDATSWAGALGLMQLMPKTALDHDKDIDGRATPDRLKTADVNIRVGVDHIFSLAKRFDSHPVLMAAAYNAGGGRITGWLKKQPNDDIALWVEDIPYLETRDYTKRVIGSYAAYQWLLGQRDFDTNPANPARL